jgi:hypothetical protein
VTRARSTTPSTDSLRFTASYARADAKLRRPWAEASTAVVARMIAAVASARFAQARFCATLSRTAPPQVQLGIFRTSIEAKGLFPTFD